MVAALLPIRAALGQSADMRAFRTQALAILREKYPQLRARRGREDSVIELDSATIDLTNIYGRVRQLPADQQQAAIVEFLDGMVERISRVGKSDKMPWAEVSKLLRPRLVSQEIRRSGANLMLREFAPGCAIAYVLDHGQQVEYVLNDMLTSWGVDSQRVHDTAIANLEGLSESVEIELRQVRGGGRFIAIDTDDSYDAARLTLPRFRGRLLAALGTPVFAGIPNRDFLVVWSADAPFDVFAAQVAKDFGKEPYPITDTVFRIDREGIRPTTAEDRRRR